MNGYFAGTGSRKAQASFEALVLIGLGAAVALASVTLFAKGASLISEERAQEEIFAAMSDFSLVAESLGEGSARTAEIRIPEGVSAAQTVTDPFGTNSLAVCFRGANYSREFPARIIFLGENVFYSAGVVRARFEKHGGVVYVANEGTRGAYA